MSPPQLNACSLCLILQMGSACTMFLKISYSRFWRMAKQLIACQDKPAMVCHQLVGRQQFVFILAEGPPSRVDRRRSRRRQKGKRREKSERKGRPDTAEGILSVSLMDACSQMLVISRGREKVEKRLLCETHEEKKKSTTQTVRHQSTFFCSLFFFVFLFLFLFLFHFFASSPSLHLHSTSPSLHFFIRAFDNNSYLLIHPNPLPLLLQQPRPPPFSTYTEALSTLPLLATQQNSNNNYYYSNNTNYNKDNSSNNLTNNNNNNNKQANQPSCTSSQLFL